MADQRDRIIVDPTANVIALVKEAIQRQDDLRAQYQESQKELAESQYKRIDANVQALSSRVDAQFSKSDTAVALASKEAATRATDLAVQVTNAAIASASQVSTMRDALEKRIQLLEQNQYQMGGASQQQAVGQLRNQWIIGIAILIGLGLLGFLGGFFRK
jgi:Cu/Ag efflux pump CusA